MSVIPIELGYANQYSQEKKKKNRQDFRSQILLQILEIFVYSISLNQAIICGLSATWFTNVEVAHKKYNFQRIP